MCNFLKNQKKKILTTLLTIAMMLSVTGISPNTSTVLAVEVSAPVITPLSIDQTGRTSGEITTDTKISFRVEDNTQITNVYYLWDRNIENKPNSGYTKVPANKVKDFTLEIPTSSIPTTPGVHELSIYAHNGTRPSLTKTIPYYVVDSFTDVFDETAPEIVMPSTTVMAINQQLELKYIEKETAVYRTRYEWSTNDNREYVNETPDYKPENGTTKIQTPSTPGIWYLKTDSTDASNRMSKGHIIAFDIRAELNPPTIEGVGSTEVFHQKGIDYTYPNVTATDDTDGVVAVEKTFDDLDTSKIGNYTITYTATDSSKNTTNVNILVHVVDYSSLNEQLEKVKDLNETDYDKDTWDKLQEEIKKAEDMRDENKSLQDLINTQVEDLTDAIEELQKEVNIKKPTITDMQVTAPAYVTEGDQITFNITTDTEINRNQRITINGVAVDVTLTGDYPNYTATVTIPSNSKMAEGPINYSFQAQKTLTTVAGNTITKISETKTDTLATKLDKTNPTIDFKEGVKYDENKKPYIELYVNDTYNYEDYLTISDNTGIRGISTAGALDLTTPRAEAYEIIYTVTDLAGNTNEETLKIYVKDYIKNIELATKTDGTATKTTYKYGDTVQKSEIITTITMAGGTKYEAVSLDDASLSTIKDEDITFAVSSLNAGTQTVTITYKTKISEGTIGTATLTYDITIAKATYNTEGVIFKDKKNSEVVENGGIPYDGTVQTVTATNLPTTPAGLSVLNHVYKNSAGETVAEVKNAGKYTVTINFQVADSENYEVPASITRTFEITKKELTLTDLDIEKLTTPIYYDKTKTVEVGVNGKEGIEGLGTINKKYYKVTAEGEVEVPEAKAVGTYKVKVSLSDSTNYKITPSSEGAKAELEVATFEIKKAKYNITGKYTFADGTAIYDGTSKTITAPTLPEGVEVLKTEYKQNGKTSDTKNAGTYTVEVTLGLSEAYKENYEIVEPQKITANLVVNPMPIETLAQIREIVDITENITDLVYNESAQDVITAVAKTDKEGVGTPVITYYQGTTKLTGAPVNAGTYTGTIKLNGATNYQITTQNGEIQVEEFTIAKKTYDMTGITITGQTQTYDGTAKKLTITGLPTGVTATIIYKNNDSQETVISGPINAGTGYKAEITFTGDNTNYEPITGRTENMVVEPKELNINDLNVTLPTSAVYKEGEGKTATVTPKTGIEGLGTLTIKYYKVTENEDGEEIETLVGTSENPATSVTNAGKYNVKVSISGASNYKITAGELAVGTFEIKKATYNQDEITFPGRTTTYSGEAQSLSIGNLPAGVSVKSYTYKDEQGNVITENGNNVQSVKNAGVYTVIANLEWDEENYEALLEAKTTAKLTINKKALTITAENQSSTYGEPVNLAQTYTQTGLVEGESLTVVLSTTATSTPEVGTYDILADITVSDNYEVTYNKGTYEILRKAPSKGDLEVTMPLNTTVTPPAVIYDKTPKAVRVVAKDGVEGLGEITIYYYKDGVEANKTKEPPIQAGTYKVKVEIAQGKNYSATTIELEDDLVIQPKKVEVKIEDKTSVYGAPIITDITKVVAGVERGDDLKLTATPVDKNNNNSPLTAETSVGEYAIVGGYDNSNYDVTFIEGKYTITAKSMSEVQVTVTEQAALVYKEGEEKEVTAIAKTIINNQEYTLIEDTDYTQTVEYYRPSTAQDTEKIEISGKEYTKIEGKPINAGTYRAVVTISNVTDGNFSGSKIAYSSEYIITKAEPTYEAPTGLKATYGALLSSVNLPEGFAFENMTATTTVGNAGTNNFTVKYTPSNTNNYNEVTGIPVTIEVSKAVYDLKDYTLDSTITKEFVEGIKQTVVDKVEGTVEVPRLPKGIKAIYTYTDAKNMANTSTDGMIDCGTYTVKIKFEIEKDGPLAGNYEKNVTVNGKTEIETTLVISQAIYKLEEKVGTITFQGNQTPVYDGNSKTLTVKNTINQEEINIDYEYYPADTNGAPIIAEKLKEAPKTAGKYVVRAVFSFNDNGTLYRNYETISPASKDTILTITKKPVEVSDLKIQIPYTDTQNKTVTYTGNAITVTVGPRETAPAVEGLGENIIVHYYKDGQEVSAEDVKDIGTYTLKVEIDEGTNYQATPEALLPLGEEYKLVIVAKTLSAEDVDTSKVRTTVEYGQDVEKAIEDTIKKAIKTGVTADVEEITYNNSTVLPTDVGEYDIQVELKGTGNYTGSITVIEAKYEVTPRQIVEEDITITEPTTNLVYSEDRTQPVSTKISTSINGTKYDLTQTDARITSTYYVETENVPEGTPETDIHTAEDGTKYVKITGEPKNAGTYVAKVTVTGLGNFGTGKDVEKYSNTYTIEKAMYELDKTDLELTLTNTYTKYDKKPHGLEIAEDKRPAGLNIVYTYFDEDGNIIKENDTPVQSVVNAGTYKVEATFTLSEELSKNYLDTELLKEKITGTLVVDKADERNPEVSLVDKADQVIEYSKELESYVIKMTAEKPTLKISNAPKFGKTINITPSNNIITIDETTKEITLNKNGEVTIEVEFPESQNYKASSTTIKITIELDGLGHDDFEVDETTDTYTYDSTPKKVTVTLASTEILETEIGTITEHYYLITETENEDGTKVENIASKEELNPTNAGKYAIFVTTTGGTKYEAVTAENAIRVGTLTINKRPITITADDKSSVYREELSALTYKITSGSLAGTDKEIVKLTTTATPTSNVGNTYKIQGTVTINDNYDITFVEGKYEITRRAPVKADLSIEYPESLVYDKTPKTVTVVAKPAEETNPAVVGLGTITVYYNDSETAPTDAGTYKVKVEIAQGDNYLATTEMFELPDLVITPKPVTVTITKATSKFGVTPSAIETDIEGVITGDDLGLSLRAVEKNGEEVTAITSSTPVGEYEIEKTASNQNYKVTYLPEGKKYAITASPIETVNIIEPEGTLTFEENKKQPVTVEVQDPTKTEKVLLTEKVGNEPGDYTKVVTYYKKVETVPAGTPETDIYTAENGTKYVKITGEPTHAGTYIAKVEITGLGNFKTETPIVKYSEEYTINKANQSAPVVTLEKTSEAGNSDPVDKDTDGTTYITKITETRTIMAVVQSAGKGNTTYRIIPQESGETIATISNTGAITLVKDGTVQIEVTYVGNDDYNAKSTTVTLRIVKDELKTGDYAIKENTNIHTYSKEAKTVDLIPTLRLTNELEEVGTVTKHYYKITEIENEDGTKTETIGAQEEINPTHAGKYAIYITTTGGTKYSAVVDPKTVRVEGNLIINPKSATVTIEEPTTKYGETIITDIPYTTEEGVVEEGDNLGISLTLNNVTTETGVGKYDIIADWSNKDYAVTFLPANAKYTIEANAITEENIIIEIPEGTLTYKEDEEHPVAVKVTNPSDTSKELIEKTAETPDGNYEKTITYYKKVEEIPAGTPASSIYQDDNGNTYIKITGVPENAGTYIAKVEITGLGNFETEAPVVKYSSEYTINKATQTPPPEVELQQTRIINEPDILEPKDGIYEIQITAADNIKAVVKNAGIGKTIYQVITSEGETPKATINEAGHISILYAGEVKIKVAFAETENYEESSVILTLNIVKGKLTPDDLAVVETDTYTYDGTPKKVDIKATIPQLADGDIGEITTYYIKTKNPDKTEVTDGTKTTTPIDAGEYAIYVEVAEGNKYEAAQGEKAIEKGTMTIAQRKIVVTPDNQTSEYKAPVVTTDKLTYKVTPGEGLTEGLLNGDELTATLSTTATNTSVVGTYPISVGNVTVSQNYAVSKKDGTYTITKRTPVATGEDADLVVKMPYDSPEVTTITFNNEQKVVVVEKKSDVVGLGGQGTPITVNYYELNTDGSIKPNTKTTEAPIKAGTYKVKVDITEGDNYKAVTDLEVVTFTISKKSITEADVVVEVPKDAIYEEGIGHPVEVKNLNGVTYTKTITYVNIDDETDTRTTPPINAGKYKAVVVATATGDYEGEITVTSDPYTIAKAEQDMTGVALTKSSVLMTENAPTITLNGKAKGAVSYSLVPNYGEDTVQSGVIRLENDGTITLVGAGKVTIQVKYGETENYAENAANLELVVAKDTVKLSNLTLDMKSSYTYNGKEQTVTVTSNLTGIGAITVTYEQNGQKVSPINAGTYDIVINVAETDKYSVAEIKVPSGLVIDPVIITDTNKDTYLTYEIVYGDNIRREVNYKRDFEPNVNVRLKDEYVANGANADVNITTLYNNKAFELALNETYAVTAHMENSQNFKFARDISIYNFKIVDTEAPTITTINDDGGNRITIDKTPVAQDFEYEKYIKVTDNYSNSGNITLLPPKGDTVNTSKIGTYTVIYTAIDENGNTGTFNLEVEVINGPPLIFYKLPAQTDWLELTKTVSEGYVNKELRTIPTINWLHGEVVIKKKHIDSDASDEFTQTYYTSVGKSETTKTIGESGWYQITVSDNGRSTTREIKVDIRTIDVALNNAPLERDYYTDVNFVIMNELNAYITSLRIEYIDGTAQDEILDPSSYTGEKIALKFDQTNYTRKIRVIIGAINGETKTVTFRINPKTQTTNTVNEAE